MNRNGAITEAVRKKIKEIELHTKRLLRGSLIGDNRAATKGSGFEFDQIREYQLGDDIRFIDWNASARMDSFLVKQYIEERSQVVLLVVDVSGSCDLGSGATRKRDTMAQIASVLALVASRGKHQVGLILFSDVIEAYIPPSGGSGHVRRIMEEVFEHEGKSRKTDITVALKKLAALRRKDAVAYLISDGIDESVDSSYFAIASKMYDLVFIRCLDDREKSFTSLGFIPMQDIETGDQLYVDMRGKQSLLDGYLSQRLDDQKLFCARYRVSVLDVANDDTFIEELIRFFRKKMRY